MNASAFRTLAVPPFVTTCLMAAAVEPRLGGAVLVDSTGLAAAEILGAFVAESGVPAVKLPVTVDRTRLLGGLAAEASFERGRAVTRRGLLDEAPAFLIDDLAAWTPERRALLRRAVGATGPARPLFAAWSGTDTPPMGFLDAVAFVIPLEFDASDDAQRVETLALRLGLRPPVGDRNLSVVVAQAARKLPDVRMSGAIDILAREACALGIEGDRAVLFAVLAARVHAALGGRDAVDDVDLEFARLAVFSSRRRSDGTSPPPQPAPGQSGGDDERRDDARRDDARGDDAGASSERRQVREPGQGEGEDEQASAEKEAHPGEAPDVPDVPVTRSPRRARRRPGGGDARVHDWERGAPERVVDRRPGARRVALAATLRRAAVRGGGNPVRVRPEDLRYWRFRRKAGRLFIIAVDASGSMARHRIREAKGVVVELLGEAYRRRDRVAVIVVRGERAELLVPPTSSVARARALMARTPVGGGTPLASALDEMRQLAEHARRCDSRDPVAILLTDGRANVAGRGDDVAADLDAAALRFRSAEMPCLVVDTAGPFSGRDDARRLAEALGADYHALPPGRERGDLVRRLDSRPPRPLR